MADLFIVNPTQFLKARRARLVVPKRVMQGVVHGPVVLEARCAGVVRTPVLRIARCVQRDRVLGVVLIAARYAACDPKCA